MPEPEEDPFAEHREWQRLSKLELVIPLLPPSPRNHASVQYAPLKLLT